MIRKDCDRSKERLFENSLERLGNAASDLNDIIVSRKPKKKI